MRINQKIGFGMMCPSKWRKKPLIVKAIKMKTEFLVETLEGTMRGKEGDYLIRGIAGEFYPCDAKIFESSYDLLD